MARNVPHIAMLTSEHPSSLIIFGVSLPMRENSVPLLLYLSVWNEKRVELLLP
jgi:hypothetical protein